ncbi:hypothetical protein HDU76_013968 [Blyttiomyces sp. JEL0837]|nr:hypothetical protein HDU76_013968 [Blyttiomyces sp. JEL0837]
MQQGLVDYFDLDKYVRSLTSSSSSSSSTKSSRSNNMSSIRRPSTTIIYESSSDTDEDARSYLSSNSSSSTTVTNCNYNRINKTSHQTKLFRKLDQLRMETEGHNISTTPAPFFNYASFIISHLNEIPLHSIQQQSTSTNTPQDRITYIREALSILDILSTPTSNNSYPPAILMTANLLITGLPTASQYNKHKPRHDLAFTYYLRAADAGSPEAAHNAALLLEHGHVHIRPPTNTPSHKHHHHNNTTPNAKLLSSKVARELHLAAAELGHPGSLVKVYQSQLDAAETLYKTCNLNAGNNNFDVANAAGKTAFSTLQRAVDACIHHTSTGNTGGMVDASPLFVMAILLLDPVDVLVSAGVVGKVTSGTMHHRGDGDDMDVVVDGKEKEQVDRAWMLLRRAAEMGHEEARMLVEGGFHHHHHQHDDESAMMEVLVRRRKVVERP